MTNPVRRVTKAAICVMMLHLACMDNACLAQPIEHLPRQSYAEHVAEAARRFAIPEPWIWAVLRQESGGRTGAVSHAGAMGLMQIMPATWVGLRARLSLGADPFDPRDNILAGTAYLRDMYDRYGPRGMLAAYNAGPGRYEAYLRDGRPLPAETQAYLRRLLPIIGAELATTTPAPVRPPAIAWRQATLFPGRGDDGRSSSARPANRDAESASSDNGGGPSTLFIIRTERRP